MVVGATMKACFDSRDASFSKAMAALLNMLLNLVLNGRVKSSAECEEETLELEIISFTLRLALEKHRTPDRCAVVLISLAVDLERLHPDPPP